MNTLLSLLALAATVSGKMIWDGRIPAGSNAYLFDSKTSPYNTQFVKGYTQKFSDITRIAHKGGLFDTNTLPFTLHINDKSIFAPSGPPGQVGFRRSEYIPGPNTGAEDDILTMGITTLHWSMRYHGAMALNFTHAYQHVFLETADFSGQVFTLSSGTPRDASDYDKPKSLVMSTGGESVHKCEWLPDVWQNYAVMIDHDSHNMTAWHSMGKKPLKMVAAGKVDGKSRRGQYHVGILKLPTGPTPDVVNQGYQSTGIDEAVTYGGVFMESGHKITIAPGKQVEGHCV